MASTDFSSTIERFSGFADTYDKFRPAPPAILSELLTRLAQSPSPALVVDLGCGTGLSTRYWAEKSQQVIGVDPSADMLRQAQAITSAANVTYREGFSHQTGLPDACADIVTCSQSLHWMEPQATFEETKRILRPGGVFAAYDYDWPMETGNWEANEAYRACSRQVDACEDELQSELPPVPRWEKSQHLARMQSSGCFRYTREVIVHHIEPGNAERLVGLMFSFGSVMTLIKAEVSEEKLGIVKLRETAMRTLGSEMKDWIFSSRIRYGIV